MATIPISYKEGNYTHNGGDTLEVGKVTEITFKPMKGYALEVDSFITIDTTINGVVRGRKLKITNENEQVVSFNTSSTHSLVVIKTVPTIKKAEPEPEKITVAFELENCTVNYENDFLVVGETYDFIFTTGENSTFYENGRLELTLNGVSRTKRIPYDENDVTKIVYNFTVDENTKDYTFILKAMKKTKVVGSFTNIYNVDDSQLNELSKERFKVMENSEVVIDYGQYIMNLLSIPFEVANDYLEPETSIKLGTLESKVKARKLNNSQLHYELGEINVPEKYKNAFDYLNSEIFIYLPFTEKSTIPIEYVMNKKITIFLDIDVFSGNGVYSLHSNGELFNTISVVIGKEVPFIQSQTRTVIGNVNTFIDNGIRTPYIEVNNYIPIENTNGYDCLERGLIKDYTGYIEGNIEKTPSNNMVKQENDIFQSLLLKGVVVDV